MSVDALRENSSLMRASLSSIYQQAAKNGDKLGLSEFAKTAGGSNKDVEKAFGMLDGDGDGQVTNAELVDFQARIKAKVKQLSIGGGLVNYLDGQSGETEDQLFTQLVSALQTKSNAKAAEADSASKKTDKNNVAAATSDKDSRLKDLIAKLEEMLKPGDVFNIEA